MTITCTHIIGKGKQGPDSQFSSWSIFMDSVPTPQDMQIVALEFWDENQHDLIFRFNAAILKELNPCTLKEFILQCYLVCRGRK